MLLPAPLRCWEGLEFHWLFASPNGSLNLSASVSPHLPPNGTSTAQLPSVLAEKSCHQGNRILLFISLLFFFLLRPFFFSFSLKK